MSFPVLAVAGFTCGIAAGVFRAADFISLLEYGLFGAGYCLGRHGPELSIVTAIYCWWFYRTKN